LDRNRRSQSLARSFIRLCSSGFLLLAVLKDTIYREEGPNVNELRDRISRAAECVTNEMFASTWRETEYRLDVCRATNGGHIEIF